VQSAIVALRDGAPRDGVQERLETLRVVKARRVRQGGLFVN
jgi:hypothetical protein